MKFVMSNLLKINYLCIITYSFLGRINFSQVFATYLRIFVNVYFAFLVCAKQIFSNIHRSRLPKTKTNVDKSF
jgi:uncharacterized protein YhhL (DUF1145 family)